MPACWVHDMQQVAGIKGQTRIWARQPTARALLAAQVRSLYHPQADGVVHISHSGKEPFGGFKKDPSLGFPLQHARLESLPEVPAHSQRQQQQHLMQDDEAFPPHRPARATGRRSARGKTHEPMEEVRPWFCIHSCERTVGVTGLAMLLGTARL